MRRRGVDAAWDALEAWGWNRGVVVGDGSWGFGRELFDLYFWGFLGLFHGFIVFSLRGFLGFIYIYTVCIYIYIIHRQVAIGNDVGMLGGFTLANQFDDYGDINLWWTGGNINQQRSVCFVWSNCLHIMWSYVYMIWVNYNDLTATSLESWSVRGIIPQWPYFRLVKYYNLPRYVYMIYYNISVICM